MEMALKQATEETHKQRLQAEINSEPNKYTNLELKAKERAEKALKVKHQREEAELKKKLDAEEDVRQKEIK
jgi:hypothetical protein